MANERRRRLRGTTTLYCLVSLATFFPQQAHHTTLVTAYVNAPDRLSTHFAVPQRKRSRLYVQQQDDVKAHKVPIFSNEHHSDRGDREEPPSTRKESEIVAFKNDATDEANDDRELEWLVETTESFLNRKDNEVAQQPLANGRISRIHLLMKAWARRSGLKGSDAPYLVERILHRLVEERDAGNTDIVIDTKLYNILLDAWSQSRDDGAAERAEQILTKMETLYKEGNLELRPDESSYNACIKAYVKNGASYDAVAKAQGILQRMEEQSTSGNPVSPNRRGYNLLLYALANSDRRGAAKEAEKVLRKMMKEYKNGNESIKPDINSFNQVITSWARGRQAGFESHMQDLLDETLSSNSINSFNITPNTDTFNTVMGGWLKSKDRGALHHVLETLSVMEQCHTAGNTACRPDRVSFNTAMAAYAKRGGDVVERAEQLQKKMEQEYGIKPDTCSNNILIDIWSKSRRPDAPQRALKVLDTMETQYKQGDKNVKPDAYTYNSVINCFVKYGVSKAPEKSHKLLDRMKELHIHHGGDPVVTSVYNAVLNAWACANTNQSVERVKALLQEMESGGDTGMVPLPDRISYNTAIKAMSQCNNGNAEQAENLLKMLESRSMTDRDFSPDVYTYTAVISAHGRSNAHDKAQRAFAVLGRMIASHHNGNISAKPNTTAFNAALNSCAFVDGDSGVRLEAFNVVLAVMGLLKKLAKPDHTTYGTVLRACSTLLPATDARRKRVVESIFRLACQEGLVSKLVVTQLRFAASPDQYQTLLGIPIEDSSCVSLHDLPQEWTCNVRENAKFRYRPRRPST